MARTAYLRDLATVIRTKNAGPFVVTADIMFEQKDHYERVKRLSVMNRAGIADLYGRSPEDILRIVSSDAALGIKVVMRRSIPAGSPGDSDVYGCQQHAPLLALPIPDD